MYRGVEAPRHEPTDFFLVDLPVEVKKNPKLNRQRLGKHKGCSMINGVYFLTGNGCPAHSDCLTCPFPECTLDKPIGRPKGG